MVCPKLEDGICIVTKEVCPRPYVYKMGIKKCEKPIRPAPPKKKKQPKVIAKVKRKSAKPKIKKKRR
ncbi:MAG: hypothetical protein QW590_03250 [Candidatus Bilamarchaeaceae archaeon]